MHHEKGNVGAAHLRIKTLGAARAARNLDTIGDAPNSGTEANGSTCGELVRDSGVHASERAPT